MNRLSEESSPYLLLHAENPVDWFPWKPEALQKARAEDKPIFLSIGYSTCYWCHVMERESFSDPAIAEMMNREFINIKVDREERPEIDEIYMTATQILTQQGGWPNSVFLTPELKPFFAGTYFPPADRHGLPSFSTVINSLSSAWRERRADVEAQAASVAAAMSRALEHSAEPAQEVPSSTLINRSVQDLRSRFDSTWGGFGAAPKFPNPSNLFLLEEVARPHSDVQEMLSKTLGAMARGGIFDHVGGGFHRYSTDREWLVPHFEKMLYDNGLLLEIYGRHFEAVGDPEIERVIRRTVAFLEREMRDPNGGFWSAIDAETSGSEGAFYVWRKAELKRVLGREDEAFLAPILGFANEPNFEGEQYILHLQSSLRDQAKRRRLSYEALDEQVETALNRLLEERAARPRPKTDDKILADWNGMAIAGLAAAGEALKEPAWIGLAAEAADFVLRELRYDGVLRHSWRGSKMGPEAFLSDYVYLVHGLIELWRVDGSDRWMQAATELTREQIDRLEDPLGGFFVAAASDDILFRSKEVVDGAVPGANAIGALNLISLAELSSETDWLDLAKRTLKAFGGFAERHPQAFRTLAVAVKRYHEASGETTDPIEAAPEERQGHSLAPVPDRPVMIDLTLSPTDEATRRNFRLHVDVAPGWYLYSPESRSEEVRPVELGAVDLILRGVTFPKGERLENTSGRDEVYVYRNCFEILGEITVVDDFRGALRFEYQACEPGRCLAPAQIELPIDD